MIWMYVLAFIVVQLFLVVWFELKKPSPGDQVLVTGTSIDRIPWVVRDTKAIVVNAYRLPRSRVKVVEVKIAGCFGTYTFLARDVEKL